MKITSRSVLAALGCSLLTFNATLARGDTNFMTFTFNDGTMQGWSNAMVSTAAAGYYDLSFGPARQTGHDNWGGGPNATWSVPGVTSNTNGTQWTPSSVGAYFLGEIPFANQIGTTVWSNWPAASSGAQQTIMSRSPAFMINDAGALTYLGCGSSYGVGLTTLSAIPAIGGTWGTASGNPAETKGSCAVGLLRDDGVFVLYKEFVNGGGAWDTYTFSTSELSSYVNDGHSYTLNVVDFWSGLNSWCAIDEVKIPGRLLPKAPSSLTATAISTNQIRLSWTDNATNETGFRIERKTGAGGTYAQIATNAANVTTYTNTGLAANTQYYYRVRANNVGATSAYCPEASATTGSPSGGSITVPNFGFETPVLSPGTFQVSPSGSYWTFSNIGISANGSGYTSGNPNAPEGTQVAFLQGGEGIWQSLSGFTVGVVYTVTFSAAQRNNISQSGQTWNVKIDGNVIASFAPPQSATSYADYTCTFTATASSHTLEFRATNLNGGDNTALIDNVRITYGSGPSLPAAPSNLAVTAVSSSQINLSWTDNANNETGFKIERKTGSGGTYAQIATTGANVSTYTNTALDAATTYYYRVCANNTSGDSVFCTEASATTQTGATGAGLQGEYFSNMNLSGTPTLTRTDATVGFDWGDSAPHASLPSDSFSVRWTGKVQPQYSQTYTFYTMSDDGVRLWVNGVQLVNNWTDHSPTENSGTIALTAGQQYNIQMEYFEHGGGAVAQLSWSSASTAKAIIPQSRLYLPSLTAPAAPSGLAATAISSSQVNLSWTDNANNETGFDVERKTGSGGTYAYVGSTGANVTSSGDSGLAASTTYYYRVRAYNAAGTSAYCTEVSVTTQPAASGAGLFGEYFNNVNLSGAATVSRTDATVNFTWGTSAPHASIQSDNFSVRWTGKVQPQYTETYTFYTMSDDGVRLWVNGVQLVNNWTGHGSTEDSGTIALTAGQQYNIQMELFDSGGDAVAQLSWSSPSTAKAIIPQARLYLPPPPSAPAAPSGLAATTASSSQINLTWTDNANNETSFEIERKTGSGGTYSQIAIVGANTTSYANSGLSASTQYYYRVRACNSGGNSTFSAEANATTDQPAAFQNPGVYSQIVNGMRYEWIPTRSVNFEIAADGKVKIIAPLTKTSFNGANTCQRFIYDHTHTRLSSSDASALFGSGLMLPAGNYGFALLWYNASSYDDVYNRGWDLGANPDTYQSNSAKVDYIHISIVPVTPVTPPGSSTPEVAIPDDLKRVSWLPHYLLLPYNLSLPAERGFGVTRVLRDVPLDQIFQKVTQIAYMYDWLDYVPRSNEWFVLRAYEPQTPQYVAQNAILDKKFGYMSQCDEDFGHYADPSNHAQKAQQVYQLLYQRFQNEQGVTSPNQTRLYDDYFSDMSGYSNGEYWRFGFNANNLVSWLSSESSARLNNGGTQVCGYFSQGAYSYRNWFQGAYLDCYERIPEGQRIYNEIYNFEKKFMAAPDRKVAKFSWIYAEGVSCTTYRHGNDARLHFPTGDIIRPDFVSWPYQMMMNESFWTLLLGHDFYLWNSSVTLVSDINTFGDSWYGGQQTTLWQPTGGSIVNYNPGNPTHPQRTNSPLGQFPEAPQLGESGSFAGAWLVSQLTTVSDRTSTTIEYCPFTYQINGGATQNGYYNGSSPFNGTLGNAKLSRYGVANYGQANIVRSYEARKPICIYTQGANGGAVIYHNVYCGLTDVNDVTITTPGGTRTFQVIGNSLHVFYIN